jgi:hypothetical protein
VQAELNAPKARLETDCIKGIQLIHIRLDAGIKCIRWSWYYDRQVLNLYLGLTLTPIVFVVPNTHQQPLSLKRRNIRLNDVGSDH